MIMTHLWLLMRQKRIDQYVPLRCTWSKHSVGRKTKEEEEEEEEKKKKK